MAIKFKKNNEKKAAQDGKKITLRDVIGGQVLANGFLERNAGLIAMILFMTFFYISNRYECQQKMMDIVKLQKKLTDVKYEALTRSAELMGGSKQSQVKNLILENGIELEESQTPPYKLTKPVKE
ncbi:MAG: FtsL-like putative cell division protein [Bacteroidota bacterium]|nr:FtsL-like putative cell division protein [Bacteroidota bacterium]